MQRHSLLGCSGGALGEWRRLCSGIVFLADIGEAPTMRRHSLTGYAGRGVHYAAA